MKRGLALSARRFGQRLRQARRARGLTQRGLFEKTGITAAHISLVERGQANPTVDTMIGLAEGVGLEVHEMLEPSGSFGDPE